MYPCDTWVVGGGGISDSDFCSSVFCKHPLIKIIPTTTINESMDTHHFFVFIFTINFLLVIFSLLPTLVYFFSVYYLGMPKGNIDMGGMWGSYIGLLFLGASFVAIGMFASTLTDNHIVSFIIAVFLCGFLYVGFDFIYSFDLFGKVDLLIKSLGINDHYKSMSRGVLDTRDMLYFFGVIAFFVLLSKFMIERRKW